MARLAIYRHAASNTVNEMIPLLRGMISTGDRVSLLRPSGSTFRGLAGEVIFNYGSSNIPSLVRGMARVINTPDAVSGASNKVNAFREMTGAGVSTVEWTVDESVATNWYEERSVVYARTTTRGHSGAGIIVCYNDASGLDVVGGVTVSDNEVVSAPLYTKGITGPRREFRIHVMGGNIVFTQQKRRRDGFADMPEASNIVRNYHTGWIYATQNVSANHAAQANAIAAVQALGLDYGAVDVITNGSNAWVLEVNTAPGMTGSNLENFCRCLVDNFYNREFAPEVTSLSEEEVEMPAEVTELAATAVSPEEASEVVEVAAPRVWAVGDRFRVTNYDQSHRARHAAIHPRHEGILREGSIMTVDSIARNGRINSSGLWFDKEWIELVVNVPAPPRDLQRGDVVFVSNLEISPEGGNPYITTSMRENLANRTPLVIVDDSRSDHTVVAVLQGHNEYEGRLSYNRDWLSLLDQSETTTQERFPIGSYFIIDNLDEDITPNPGVTTSMQNLMRSGTQIQVEGHSREPVYIVTNSFSYHPSWIRPVVEPQQEASSEVPEGSGGVFKIGDKVRVSNLRPEDYRGSSTRNLRRFLENQEILTVSSNTDSRGFVNSYDLFIHSNSLMLVEESTPIRHTTPLRIGDRVKVDNTIGADGRVTVDISFSAKGCSYRVSSVDGDIVRLYGETRTFLASMLKVSSYTMYPGDTFCRVDESYFTQGGSITDQTVRTVDRISSHVILDTEGLSFHEIRAKRLSSGSLFNENPRNDASFVRGDRVLFTNSERVLTDIFKSYPHVNPLMDSAKNEGRVLVVDEMMVDGSIRLNDGHNYNPHWLVKVTPEVLARIEAEKVEKARLEAEEEARIAELIAAVVEPEDNSVCKITIAVGSLKTVGLYSAPRKSFDVVGFELPIGILDISDCEILGTL